jgi:PEP-CTERM motif
MEIFDTDNSTNRPVNVNVISKVVESFSSGNIIDLQQIATWGLYIAPRDEPGSPILSLGDTITNSNFDAAHPIAHIVDTDAEVIFKTNTLYAVTVSLYFAGGGMGSPEIPFPGLTEIAGFIDPTFELITPEPGLELVLSRGLESASAVPEPSTWAMLLIGFAGLGYAGFKRASNITLA